MKIVLLGSGNVATHIGKGLYQSGISVAQVWSRNLENAKQLATSLHSKATDSIEELDRTADLYLLSVVDNAIAPVLNEIGSLNGTLVHTSGSTEMNVLKNTSSRFGVFYPLQTFSKEVALDMEDMPILLEASEEIVKQQLLDLAARISSNVRFCDSSQRLNLHLAAVFACNFSNHFFAIAQQILEENGLDFSLIRPLIAETAEKVRTHLPTKVQTGPAVREDWVIVNKHKEALAKNPDLLALYSLLSDRIAAGKLN